MNAADIFLILLRYIVSPAMQISNINSIKSYSTAEA